MSVGPPPGALLCPGGRDVFFCGATSLPLQPLLENLPGEAGVVDTLIGASAYGAEVPTRLIMGALERAGSERAWAQFAGLGREETYLALGRHPEFVIEIAAPALRWAPDLVIPHLLRAATGDRRPRPLILGIPSAKSTIGSKTSSRAVARPSYGAGACSGR